LLEVKESGNGTPICCGRSKIHLNVINGKRLVRLWTGRFFWGKVLFIFSAYHNWSREVILVDCRQYLKIRVNNKIFQL